MKMQNKNQTADIAKIQEAVASKQPSERGEIVELIIFTIGTEEFAADINQVREVIAIQRCIAHRTICSVSGRNGLPTRKAPMKNVQKTSTLHKVLATRASY